MSARSVKAERLTAAAFAPFGDVISARAGEGHAANQGTAIRLDFAARLENLRPAAKANMAVFSSAPQKMPFLVKLLERHPASTQAFLPMACARYLICVAPSLPDGGPDVSGLRAFVCGAGEGINYRPGVWHHPIIAIDGPAEFVMLAWEDGSETDCEEQPLNQEVELALTQA